MAVRLLVTVEGGIVQSILTDDTGDVEIILRDFDNIKEGGSDVRFDPDVDIDAVTLAFRGE